MIFLLGHELELIEICAGEMASDVLTGCVEARKGILGPFSPSFDPNLILGKSLDRILPDDVHLRVRSFKK